VQEDHQDGIRRDLRDCRRRIHFSSSTRDKAAVEATRTSASWNGREGLGGEQPLQGRQVEDGQLDRDRPEDGDQQKWVGPGAQEKLSRSDGTAGAWPSWSNARVVKTIICHGKPHQEAEAE
jgi:hypothetical protein